MEMTLGVSPCPVKVVETEDRQPDTLQREW